jgi:hypothetical protein
MKDLIIIIFIAFILLFTLWCVIRIFGQPVSLNMLPSFLAGEKVLFFKRWVWAGSWKSWPTCYRWNFSTPPFTEQGLYITDRRVLEVIYIFRTIKLEYSLWFEGRGGPGDNEFVKEVNVGKSWIVGPYLEVVSESSVKQWWRSRRLQSRFFMKNPESVRRVITETITKVPGTTD